uniref:Uncharacterized protein n=1 Tax=Opuntia streptacantha TaxID=393608 RepID=A0A7C9AHP1_OPUST
MPIYQAMECRSIWLQTQMLHLFDKLSSFSNSTIFTICIYNYCTCKHIRSNPHPDHLIINTNSDIIITFLNQTIQQTVTRSQTWLPTTLAHIIKHIEGILNQPLFSIHLQYHIKNGRRKVKFLINPNQFFPNNTN